MKVDLFLRYQLVTGITEKIYRTTLKFFQFRMAFRAKPYNREFFFTMNASYGAIPGIQPFLLTIRAGDEISHKHLLSQIDMV